MLFSSIPAKFQIPWANSAGGGFIRTVPQASQIAVTPGAASLTDGFPPLNFQPVGSGGVPPFGQDMNGILKQITQWSQWQGAGGTPQYDATFSTAVGGYPQGAIVSSTQAGFLWLNTVDNNTTNPDNPSSNVGWIPIITHAPSSTIYVRTDGNDNNNGSANNAGSAFLTIAAAAAKVSSSFYLGSSAVTIQLGNTGAYAAPGPISAGSGTVIIRGDPANQANYTISGTGSSGAVVACQSGTLQLVGLSISNTSTTSHNVSAGTGGALTLTNVTLGTTGITTGAHINAGAAGGVTVFGGCVFQGQAAAWGFANSGGVIAMAANVTFTTPVYSNATALVTGCGNIITILGVSFSGTATGTRYSASLNGVINTGGGGANFFPGNAAGTTATGGQYA